MRHSKLPDVPPWFWQRAAEAGQRVLMLDYDGTLAPFQLDPAAAVPHPRSLQMVRRIAGRPGTTLAVISGRPIEDLDRLLGALPAWLVGEHGWESRAPGGRLVLQPLSEEARVALLEAAARLLECGWARCMQIKRTALMLHSRAMNASEASSLEADCDRIWREHALAPWVRRDRVDGGLELRARGFDKGTGVRGILDASAQGAFAVYLGDDDSDEDAFGAVRETGLGIRVGARPRPSLAQGRLASWDEVAEFLERWWISVEGGVLDGARAS